MTASSDSVEVRGVPEETEALARRSFPPDLPLLTTPRVVIYPGMASPLVDRGQGLRQHGPGSDKNGKQRRRSLRTRFRRRGGC